MKLIDDWRGVWRYLSVHALAVTGVLPGVWMSLPHEWRDSIPLHWLAVVTVVTAALGVYGRMIDQHGKTGGAPKP